MSKKICKAIILCFALGLLFSSAYANASGLIKQGMSGDDVKRIQTELKKLGYFNESITGYFGDVTRQAVERYQRDRNFGVDGVVGPATWSSLVGGSMTASASVSTGSYPGSSLKEGMDGDSVSKIQSKLKQLGFFNENVTGYFGSVTKSAVISFQRSNGLDADGVVGAGTWSRLFGGSAASRTTTTVSRGSSDRGDALVSWGTASGIFSVGTVATVIDINTGIKFNIRRSFGTNHADCETVSADDTAKMKRAFGGSWNWDRRAVVLVVNGRRLAASMAGMPHAGVDSKPGLQTVSGRSGGYGYGQNLDMVKGNNMSGHFDVHFLNSRTHGTNSVDYKHQAAVKRAANYIASH